MSVIVKEKVYDGYSLILKKFLLLHKSMYKNIKIIDMK